MILILVVMVFITSIEVVIARHQSRKLFVEIQEYEKTRDQLNEEWGRLQLEQSTWATDNRIESLARDELKMIPPVMNAIVLIK